MPISNQIKKIQHRLPHVMLKDREGLSRRLKNIQQKRRGRYSEKQILQQLGSLEKRIGASVRERQTRLAGLPSVTLPKELPITAKKDQIVQAIRDNQVVIIAGDTGSGKSTQIPKMCLLAGRGIGGKIGCTQPRRIAATTIARRIAEELEEEIGQSVGYKIRFREKSGKDAYIKIMTDGILLAETQQDRGLREYDTLIIDEAHERSLNIDFLLGILRNLLLKRKDLKLIITSATLDTAKFSEAFDSAPVVEVGGRMYPVEVEYMPIDPRKEETGETTYVDMAIKAVDRIFGQGRGDILVFMPTEQDILETCDRLRGRQFQGTTILPLFARLPGSEQARVYSVSGRKIVVATNVAETSLTIPGIKYVIDTGWARISRYVPSTRTTSLPISPISKSSADQRKGRCGRVSSGICIRLYSQEDYEARPAFTPPEILRSNLAEVILRMISLGLGQLAAFPFLDRPNPKSIKDGHDLLFELGAIKRSGKGFLLTEKGHIMARMPMDPKISRMIIEARKEGCVKEVAIIAAALSIQDPRERPLEKAALADQMHRPFLDQDSDFTTLLNIWRHYHRSWAMLKTQNKMRKFCKQNFLSFPRMREWHHIHEQIITILKEQRMGVTNRARKSSADPLYTRIHRAILSGYLSNIALNKEKNIYTAARGREAMIFPGSTLFNKAPSWIVAADMVKTSRLFARTAARIDCQWLESLGGDLCRSSYSNPHWEKNRGEVRAQEQVTLYGLIIVSDRPVSYGPIDPKEAHDIFIQSALVEGRIKQPPPFLIHNLSLIKTYENMEDKVRRRDILVSEAELAEFYSKRLEGVCDTRTLNKVIKERGEDDFLRMKDSDLILSFPDEAALSQYPDQMAISKTLFDCIYKFAPGKQDDGVTIRIPSGLASTISAERIDWGVPGLLREKITALIKGLPKRYRKQLVPVSKTVDKIMAEMAQEDEPLITALARFIYRGFGVDIPVSVWSAVEIPDRLKMRVSITDHRGREVESDRDLGILKHAGSLSSVTNDSAVWKKARKKWEKSGLTAWDFDSLPESITLGTGLFAYPGLEPDEEGVNIRIFHTPEEALDAHKLGIERLFSIHFSKELKFFKKSLSIPAEGRAGAKYFGGMRQVENAIFQALLRSLFQKNLRTSEEFRSHAESLRPVILPQGEELMTLAAKALNAYHQTRESLHTIERGNKTNGPVRTLCSQIREELDGLVPENFFEYYSTDRLCHIPRYLKALQVRAERGANDPEKDRRKMLQAGGLIKAFREMVEGLPPHASREKKEAVEEYRWMIEEFKVSLFAQELKTQFPVSQKRLEKKQEEIERML